MTDSLFITGADGFIGRRLVKPLAPDAFHRLASDLQDTDSYASDLDGQTTVVHLAAQTGKARDNEYFQANVEGTRALIRACKSRGVPRFLHVSTIATTFDDVDGYPYAASKQQAEQLVQESGLEWTIVRPTIVLGPGSAALDGFRPLLRRSTILVPGGGGVRMQPVHVDDVADVLLRLARSATLGNRIYELGGPEVLTLGEFLSRAHAVLYGGASARRVHVPIRPIRALLRLVETVAPGLAPVHPGQLSAFFNDSVAAADLRLMDPQTTLRSVETMLDAWAAPDGAG
jgi:NADH dehydrogenase